ncbi:MAG: transposase [Balneolaceae bacterium]|nr:transposase [Balneolaceae bacterium]
MKFVRENIYHIYNRGNNKQNIFFEEKNYHFFLQKMRTHLLLHCHLLAWCLMPNHFHWMIQVRHDYETIENEQPSENKSPVVQPLNKSVSTLLSSYTKAVNNMYDRTGSLFQRRTKSKNLSPGLKTDNNYPLICFLYIHQNPIRSGLVENFGDWPFSSYQDYAGLRNGKLCNKKLATNLLDIPKTEDRFIQLSKKSIPDRFVGKIL